jgi:REP element-mobilizing transposase RayT
MPRSARIDAPGALHHIICRGFERRSIFRDDKDRDDFLERLSRVLTETKTPCYAWVLIPNHFHLLLRNGGTPITTIMRRLLTGYAVSFNKRHHRKGRLFRNRYKSILCQEERYFLELVRYIHLNPLRAGLVNNLETLNTYPYCGQSVLMGKVRAPWQDTGGVLSLFSGNKPEAIHRYIRYMEKGVMQGRRAELMGGGLYRSPDGWGELKSSKDIKSHRKGDERILGDHNFIRSVLERSQEDYERGYRLKSRGYTLDMVLRRASELFQLPIKAITSGGKQPDRVKARSVAAYWAVRELGMNGTLVGRKIGLSQSAVSRAVQRGEQLSEELSIAFEKDLPASL